MQYHEVVNGRGKVVAAGLTEGQAHKYAVHYNKKQAKTSANGGAYARPTRVAAA